jgi:hypothetical protein
VAELAEVSRSNGEEWIVAQRNKRGIETHRSST